MANENDNLTADEAVLLAELEAEIAAGGGDADDDDDPTPPADADEAARLAADNEAKAAKDKKAADDAAAAAVKPADAPDPDDRDSTVRLSHDATKAQEELDGLIATRADLRKKYAAGEIERDAYDAQIDDLNDQIVVAKVEVSKADIYEDINAQTAKQKWTDAVTDFLEEPENAIFKEGGALNAALDAKIRKMNVDKDVVKQFPSHTKRLAEAKRIVLEETRKALGIETAKPAATTAPKKPAVELPPGVDDVPAAGEEAENEFSHLDRLTGTARESAFAKLTKDQQDRYLAGA